MLFVCSATLTVVLFFFFNDTATTEIYTLSLHDALPIANITLRPAARVTGIVPAADGAGVRGIRFVNGSGGSEILDADLVVDASGLSAPTLTLLDALGWDRPQMTEIGVDISYATVVVEIPPDATADWKLVLTLPDPPHGLFHAVMAPTEDGRWIIVIAAHSGGWWIDTWDA